VSTVIVTVATFVAVIDLSAVQAASTNDRFSLDLSPGAPATIEDERRRHFEQHYDCVAGNGVAGVCAHLEDRARQRQIDALRQSTTPAGMPPPAPPPNYREAWPARGISLPGGR